MEFEENMNELGIDVGEVISIQEEGTEEDRDFRIMYIFDIEDRTYLCLVPVDQEDEEEYEIHFLRFDGSDTLLKVMRNGKMWRLHLMRYSQKMRRIKFGN